MTVQTKAELLSALADASAGDTVFIPGTVEIDLTTEKAILIPAGVTLASDRGDEGSKGALLFSSDLDAETTPWSQFLVGSGSRVTGLRLEGPDQQIRTGAKDKPIARGLNATDASDVIVDNNEIFGWAHAGVYMKDSLEVHVENNYIHHNRRRGLGYGVVLVGHSSAVIEHNDFDQNRHHIAGNGNRYQRYEARFNLVRTYAESHGFDMHGEGERTGIGPYAGDVMHIKHNTFLRADYGAIAVRGKPYTGAWISQNCFRHVDEEAATTQVHTLGNFFVGSNRYNISDGSCHTSGRRVAWRMSDGGAGPWQPMGDYTFDISEVAFGDFDGDGKDDVFRATGAYYYYSPGGTGPWVKLSASPLRGSWLRLGDFDGDGVTDVFAVIDGQWKYSPGAKGPWVDLAAFPLELAELRFGDFDGDHVTDVANLSQGKLRYSPGGTGAWVDLISTNLPLSDFRFGDFDGDGRTDVFRQASDDTWSYSSGGATPWTRLRASRLSIGSVKFGDFDGDGKTDVFTISSSGEWMYSSGATSPWIPLSSAHGCSVKSLHTESDFTGDGMSDVFDGRCGG